MSRQCSSALKGANNWCNMLQPLRPWSTRANRIQVSWGQTEYHLFIVQCRITKQTQQGSTQFRHKHEPAIHSIKSWSVLHLILQWPDFWSQAALLLGRGECIMLTTSCYVQSSFIGCDRCQIWPPEICMTYLFTQDHGPLALFLAQNKHQKKGGLSFLSFRQRFLLKSCKCNFLLC